MKIGLKLWSTNEFYIQPALNLFNKGIFDYIELYVVPDSLNYLTSWKNMEIPFILHAPHSLSGLNPSMSSCEKSNFDLIEQVDEYRKILDPEFIIFHPGLDGSLQESIRQFIEIRKKFPEVHKCMLVENKPEVGLNDENCIGSNPQEISLIMNEANIQFCFDIGHAICAANSSGTDWKGHLKDFLKLKPVMLHLSDGDIKSEKDMHLNYGTGTFEFSEILTMIPENSHITIETEKLSSTNLDDFERDAKWLSANIQQ